MLVACVVAMSFGGPAASGERDDPGAEPSARPNILLLLADNWAYPHTGADGDPHVRTPTFDAVCSRGIRCTRAFCQVPSCSPARAVLLTGQAMHRLGSGANLWGDFPNGPATYPERLEAKGYVVGFTGKGWGPGRYLGGSPAKQNPAGEYFENFTMFLDSVPDDRPFCFWFGSRDPHRPWDRATASASESAGSKEAPRRRGEIAPPPYLPDDPIVKDDIRDYYGEVERFDRECGEIIEAIRREGRYENTLIVMVGDNGWQMPRGLAHIYDPGTHVPLAMQWPGRIPAGRVVNSFVSFEDLGPTFVDAASAEPLPQATGESLLPQMRRMTQHNESPPRESSSRTSASSGRDERDASEPFVRDCVFLERERHANVRAGDAGYPVRAIRTERFLYVVNLFPDRWPAGDPELHFAVGPFGDVDGSPTKEFLLERRNEPGTRAVFELGFGKRPLEELYDMDADPHQMKNVAAEPRYARDKSSLRRRLADWLTKTGDPRAAMLDESRPVPSPDPFDKHGYYGSPARSSAATKPATP